MKIIYMTAILAAALIFAACDEVEAPYQPDASELINAIGPNNKNVLILEFTGWQCGNCPKAHHTVHELEKLYPEGHIVAVGIHAGSYAVPFDGPDFRTEVSTQLEQEFQAGLAGFPIGIVNMKKIDGSFLAYVSAWEKEVFKEAILEKQVDIQLDAKYSNSTKDIKVNVAVDYLQPSLSGSNLSVYLVQDSIIAKQKNDELKPPMVEDYVHMNVLRESFNGVWGVPVNASSNTREFTMNIADKPDWKPENLRVVAFVHDYKGTREVFQAVQTKLTISE
jgi:hypothetical protein